MNRNNTLNEVVFAAALHAHLTPEVLAEFHQTALDRGLAEDEVQATIQSALDGAARSWHLPFEWLKAVHVHASTRPVNRRLGDAAFVIAYTLATAKWAEADLTLSMSCRQLAEHLGVHHDTASLLIRDLRSLGLIIGVLPPGQTKTHVEHARAYRLTLRNDLVEQFSDTLPVPRGGDGSVSDIFLLARLRRELEVRSHRLFQAAGGRSGFTAVDAAVLLWLDDVGEGTLRDAITASGATRKTVQGSIARLLSAGFLDWHDDVLRRAGREDLLAELDQAADFFDIPDKDQRRREIHQEQRRIRAQRLAARSKAFKALDEQIGDKWRNRRQDPPGTADAASERKPGRTPREGVETYR